MSTRENKLSLRFLAAVALAAATMAGAVLASTNRTQLAGGVAPAQDDESRIREKLRRLPLSFEVNGGQAHEKIKFLSRGSGYAFYITPTASYIGLAQIPSGLNGRLPKKAPASFVAMRLLGADPKARVSGEVPSGAVTNYLIGDSRNWKKDLANYDRVRVSNAYPGIDVVYYGNQQELEHDFVVAPGASPNQIRLRYDNVREAKVDSSGELVLQTREGEIRQRAPIAYQTVNGKQVRVPAAYVVSSKTEVAFSLGEFDSSRTLVIDPILRYSTFLGGSFDEYAFSVVLDADRNAYIAGYTGSFDQDPDNTPGQLATEEGGTGGNPPKGNKVGQAAYPILNQIMGDPDRYCVGFDMTEANPNNANARFPDITMCYSRYDAVLTKINSDASAMIYSTYMGSEDDDYGLAVALDSQRNAYLTGSTQSIFWPLINPLQTSNGGGSDIFVVKITPGGNGLIFSTYVGGSGADLARSIAVDNTGNTHLAGVTSSTDFPTFATNGTPHQGTYGGGASDAFLISLDASGSAYNYSTYFGGNGDETGVVAAVSSGLTYVPNSLSLPWQTQIDVSGPNPRTFPNGFNEPFATHLGADVCIGVAVDSIGNAYLTGGTTSTNMNGRTTTPSFQAAKAAGTDGFLAKFDPSGNMGNAFPGTYFSFIGGSSDEAGRSVAVDLSGNAHITGYTRSTNFPAFVPGGASAQIQSANQGGTDAFIAKFNNAGSDLVFSAYLGGNGEDIGHGVAVSAGGQAYVCGHTNSTNFPTKQFLQSALRGFRDVFVTKYRPDASSLEYSTYLGSTRDDRAISIAVDNRGQAYIVGHTNSVTWPFTANRCQNFVSRTGGDMYGPYPDTDMFAAYLFAPPFAASNLVVVDLQQTSISLAWQDNADNEDGYEIERKLGTSSSSNPFTVVGNVGPNQVTFTDSGLSPSTTYTYRVRGYNNDGVRTFYGPYSNQVTAETLPDIPGTPSGLTATPIDTTRIKLDWTDNSNNEVSFKIERRRITAPTTAFAEIKITGPNVVTFTDTGLTPNTTYEYRIRSSNSAGDSPYAGPVQATTLPNKPNTAPTNLTATAVSNTQIDLAWTYSKTDHLGFKIDRSSDGINFTPLRTTATPNVTTFSDTGLAANTTLFYRVRAYNQSGDGPNSNVASATTLPDPPADASNLVLKLNGSGVVGTWKDNSSDESGFRVEESVDDFATVSFTLDTQPNVTSFQRDSLQPNTIYSYRVIAFKENMGGRSNSQNPPEGRILLRPSTPTNLAVTSHTETTIDLSWQDNNPVGPSTFKVERALADTANWAEVASVTAPTVGGVVTHQDPNLTPNTEYKYRVRAFNTPPLGVVGGGFSPYTPTVRQWTLPNPASNLSALPFTGPPPRQWVVLNWTDNNTPDASHKVQRKRVTAPVEAAFSTIATVSAGTNTYTDEQSLGNIRYEYQVVAFNDGPSGDGAPSNIAGVRTLPAKPTDFTATVPTDGNPRRGRTQIDLAWTDASGSPTRFEVWQSTDGVNFTLIIDTAIGAVSATATGLTPDTDYWFKVRGVNATGPGSFSNTLQARTLKRPPLTPTGLTATVQNDVEIRLKWEDNSTDEQGFRIERKIGSGNFATLIVLGANAQSYVDGGLAPSTTYVYRVIAFNNGGDSTPSPTAGGKTAPGAPSNLVLSNVTATSLRVTFKDNAIDEEGFKLERKTNTGSFVLIATIAPRAGSGNTVVFDNTGLSSGVTYAYRVRSFRGSALSRYSNTASTTTP